MVFATRTELFPTFNLEGRRGERERMILLSYVGLYVFYTHLLTHCIPSLLEFVFVRLYGCRVEKLLVFGQFLQ